MVFKTELSSKGVTFCIHLQCSSRFLHVKPFVPLQRPTLRRTTTRQPSLLTLATIPISCYFALLLFQHLLSHGELPHAQCCVYAAADKGGRPPNGSWLMVANDQTLKKCNVTDNPVASALCTSDVLKSNRCPSFWYFWCLLRRLHSVYMTETQMTHTLSLLTLSCCSHSARTTFLLLSSRPGFL